MKLKYGEDCPPSTVYAILKREGLISKTYRKRRTKVHTKRYRRPWPGWLQMDFKYVPYRVLGKQLYQLSAIDHHSSWRFMRVYEDRSEQTVLMFLNELSAACPFPIWQIQTDNATEFTDKYSAGRGTKPTGAHAVDQWCDLHDIEHKLIPIGEKELNGKVECSHKYDDEEFYSLVRAETIDGLEVAVINHCRIWNTERHTKTLGWKTPDESVEHAQIVALALILAYKDLDLEKMLAIEYETRLTPLGTVTIQRDGSPPKPRKKPNFVNRYLQYTEWAGKPKIKSLFPAPLMSQIFPEIFHFPFSIFR
jgi:Integrase core domain